MEDTNYSVEHYIQILDKLYKKAKVEKKSKNKDKVALAILLSQASQLQTEFKQIYPEEHKSWLENRKPLRYFVVFFIVNTSEGIIFGNYDFSEKQKMFSLKEVKEKVLEELKLDKENLVVLTGWKKLKKKSHTCYCN